MINELAIFKFQKHNIRVVERNGQPWFLAKDVCIVLGLHDTYKAIQTLEDDEKLTRKIFVSGQNREMWFINESGLYAIIIRSSKPEARKFRKWITAEVLPAIRRTGGYMPDTLPLNQAKNIMIEFLHGQKRLDDCERLIEAIRPVCGFGTTSSKNGKPRIELCRSYWRAPSKNKPLTLMVQPELLPLLEVNNER